MPMTSARVQRFVALKAQFPAMAEPRWSLATALADEGHHAEAVTELRELVELKPDYCVAHLRLGSCLMELEQWQAAHDALTAARQTALAQGHEAPRVEADMLLAEVAEELQEL